MSNSSCQLKVPPHANTPVFRPQHPLRKKMQDVSAHSLDSSVINSKRPPTAILQRKCPITFEQTHTTLLLRPFEKSNSWTPSSEVKLPWLDYICLVSGKNNPSTTPKPPLNSKTKRSKGTVYLYRSFVICQPPTHTHDLIQSHNNPVR